jgi:hypothetical protein
MFGFVFGSACLMGLAMMAARGRRGFGRHHGFFRHGPGGHHGHHGRGGFGRRALYHLLDRLDTTPGQDKAILGAIDDFQDSAREARQGLGDLRKQIAEAFRNEHFDETAFTAIFDEPLRRMQTLRDELTKNAATVHEALNQKQREQVADLVGSTTRWGYGHACGC